MALNADDERSGLGFVEHGTVLAAAAATRDWIEARQTGYWMEGKCAVKKATGQLAVPSGSEF